MLTEEKTSESPSDSVVRHFFRANIAWIATAVFFLFLTAELLVVSKANISTAAFILMHSDKIQLFLILILPFLPTVMAFLGFLSFWVMFVFNQEGIPVKYPWLGFLSIVGIILTVMAFFAGTFLVVLVAGLYAYIVLDFKLKINIKSIKLKHWPIGRKIPESGIYQLFNRREPTMFLSYSLIYFFTFITTSMGNISIPFECDYLTSGKTLQTQILSTDARYAYAINSIGFRPQIINLNNLQERNPLKGSTCPVPLINKPKNQPVTASPKPSARTTPSPIPRASVVSQK